LLQSERKAMLFIDVLRSYVGARKFQLHDFVVMPDHAHLLITVGNDMTIERAMQFIKGGIFPSLKKEFGYRREVWQRRFFEVRVDNRQCFLRYRDYMAQDPVKAGLADSPGRFPYGFSYCAKRKAAGA
jgi:putative transposase